MVSSPNSACDTRSSGVMMTITARNRPAISNAARTRCWPANSERAIRLRTPTIGYPTPSRLDRRQTAVNALCNGRDIVAGDAVRRIIENRELTGGRLGNRLVLVNHAIKCLVEDIPAQRQNIAAQLAPRVDLIEHIADLRPPFARFGEQVVAMLQLRQHGEAHRVGEQDDDMKVGKRIEFDVEGG